jgi:hypothetical protein
MSKVREACRICQWSRAKPDVFCLNPHRQRTITAFENSIVVSAAVVIVDARFGGFRVAFNFK